MSLPESMSRIVIVGTKTHIDEAIEAKYDVKAIQLIDHTVGEDGDGERIGYQQQDEIQSRPSG